jgi:hypothetical protein
MLENLLKTWGILAPDEWPRDYPKDATKDGYKYSQIIKGRFWLGHDNLQFQDLLQGYIQQCISARGWRWKTGNVTGHHWALVWILEENISTLSSSPDSWIKPLLESYLKALADQRPITQGPWKHADGNIYWVTDAHEWSEHGFYSFLNEDWSYSLEEHPNIKIQMSSSNYNASQDYGDRVFYYGNSGQWAPLKYSFLDLKDDGRLRFEKVDG